jgi:hypothetical protein
MIIFLNILAAVFLILSLVRLYFVFIAITDKETMQLIRLAEACGGNPIGDTAKKPVIVFIVCLCWIISRFFS